MSCLCEFCGEEVDYAESTSFCCNYCIDCLKLVLFETKAAIKNIRDDKREAAAVKREDRNAKIQC